MAYYSYDQFDLAFSQADTNHDGVLDRHEFRNFIAFQNADRNRDGRISLAEFATTVGMSLIIR